MNTFRKIIAVSSALIIALSFAACGDKTDVETTTAAPETTASAVTESTTAPVVTEESTTEETTIAETTTEIITTTSAPTTKPTTTSAPATTLPTTAAPTTKPTTAAPTTAKAPEATTQKAAVPATKKEIVDFYNQATATAASAKPSYKKVNETALSNLKMGALAKINLVRETVGDFLGEGTTTTNAKKGTFNGSSLVNSTLKEADVISATCTPTADGKYYNIKITVKTETNPSKSGSALSRFTKDFKDVKEIRAGLAEAGASLDDVTIKTTSVVITAKIEAATNRFVSLNHTFKMSAVLTNVKYSIAKVKQASADLSTTVDYSTFKY